MQYVAINLHKRYSVVSALNEQGQRTREARIEGNSAAGFAQYFRGLGEPSKERTKGSVLTIDTAFRKTRIEKRLSFV
jgi:hypothetical protein